MNTDDMNTDRTDDESRPLGYWLKAADRHLAAAFAEAFAAEGVGRREWRLLNVIDGAAPSSSPLREHKLDRLIALGWVAKEGEAWSLTDEGAAAKDRLGRIVQGLRARVTEAVPAEDLETTLRSLERIALAFGWSEDAPLPRGGGRGHGRGRGRGRGRGFGHRRGFGRGDAFESPGAFERRRAFEQGGAFERRGGFDAGHDFDESRPEFCDRHPGHGRDGSPARRGGGHARFARKAQEAYARGFDAGFARGRTA